MKQKILLLIALVTSLAAKVEKTPPPAPKNPIVQQVEVAQAQSYWKYHHWASVGYRRDRQKFAGGIGIDNVSQNSQYRDRNTLQLLLGSHLEWHKLVLGFRGSYGWLLNGNLHTTGTHIADIMPHSVDTYKLGAGYTADVQGALGYRFAVWNSRNTTVSLIPSGGYKYSHIMNDPQGQKEHIGTTLGGLVADWTIDLIRKPNQQDWFGPYVEGRLEFLFWECCEWGLFYQYHWPTFRSRSKELEFLSQYPPGFGDTSDVQDVRFNSMYKGSFIGKQLGGTDFRYRAKSGWNAGLHFEGSVASTHKARYIEKLNDTVLTSAGFLQIKDRVSNDSATVLWVCYDVSLSLGYQF